LVVFDDVNVLADVLADDALASDGDFERTPQNPASKRLHLK
jgi:hypothetical protein